MVKRREEVAPRHILVRQNAVKYPALQRDAPESRAIPPLAQGVVVELPQVGGLHHRDERNC